jgi:transcription elongation factor
VRRGFRSPSKERSTVVDGKELAARVSISSHASLRMALAVHAKRLSAYFQGGDRHHVLSPTSSGQRGLLTISTPKVPTMRYRWRRRPSHKQLRRRLGKKARKQWIRSTQPP